METEFLEQCARRDHALDVLLGTAGQFEQRRGETEHVAGAFAGGVEGAAGHQAGQDVVQRPDRRRDRHLVVVEDDEHVGVGDAGVVERLEGHAGRHRAVADDGDDLARLALLLGGQRHAERGGDRGRRMADAERVVRALAALGKAGNAAVHAQAVHAGAPAGEHLVRVALVADVPDQPVLRRVEDGVQGDGQFDGAEVGRQVAAGLRH